MLKSKVYFLYTFILFCALSIILVLGFVLAQNTHQKDAITVRLISMAELKSNLEHTISLSKNYSESTNFARRIKNIVMPFMSEINMSAIAFIGNEDNSSVFYAYSSDPKYKLAKSLPKIFAGTHDLYKLIDFQGLKWIKVDLYQEDRSGYEERQYVGAFIMGFPKEVFMISLGQFIVQHFKVLMAIFLITSALLALLVFKSPLSFVSPDGFKLHNKFYILVFIVVCQLALGSNIVYNLNNYYVEDAQNVVRDTVLVQAKSMNRVFELGLPLSTFKNSENFIKSKLELSEDIYCFKIMDKDKNTIAEVIFGKNRFDTKPIQAKLSAKNQLMGYIEASIDIEAIYNNLKSDTMLLMVGVVITLLLNLAALIFYQRLHHKAHLP